jgi:hypothetical protein
MMPLDASDAQNGRQAGIALFLTVSACECNARLWRRNFHHFQMQALIVLPMLAVVGGIVWLVLKGRQLQKEQDFERKVQARKLGWKYDGTRGGRIDYRFAGSARGVDWSMWYDSDRGDDSPTPKAYWNTANIRTPELSLVIIGRKRFQIESGAVGRILMGVVSGVAQAMTGSAGRADKAEFYETAMPLDEGRPAFRERFVAAVAPDMPRGWLDEELQGLLLNWPEPRRGGSYRGDERVEVTLRADGLQIVAQQMPEDFAFWQHLARLGAALAGRLGRHSG